jgi:hypothetical protein
MNGRVEFFRVSPSSAGTFEYTSTIDPNSLNASKQLPSFKPCNFRRMPESPSDPTLAGDRFFVFRWSFLIVVQSFLIVVQSFAVPLFFARGRLACACARSLYCPLPPFRPRALC